MTKKNNRQKHQPPKEGSTFEITGPNDNEEVKTKLNSKSSHESPLGSNVTLKQIAPKASPNGAKKTNKARGKAVASARAMEVPTSTTSESEHVAEKKETHAGDPEVQEKETKEVHLQKPEEEKFRAEQEAVIKKKKEEEEQEAAKQRETEEKEDQSIKEADKAKREAEEEKKRTEQEEEQRKKVEERTKGEEIRLAFEAEVKKRAEEEERKRREFEEAQRAAEVNKILSSSFPPPSSPLSSPQFQENNLSCSFSSPWSRNLATSSSLSFELTSSVPSFSAETTLHQATHTLPIPILSVAPNSNEEANRIETVPASDDAQVDQADTIPMHPTLEQFQTDVLEKMVREKKEMTKYYSSEKLRWDEESKQAEATMKMLKQEKESTEKELMETKKYLVDAQKQIEEMKSHMNKHKEVLKSQVQEQVNKIELSRKREEENREKAEEALMKERKQHQALEQQLDDSMRKYKSLEGLLEDSKAREKRVKDNYKTKVDEVVHLESKLRQQEQVLREQVDTLKREYQAQSKQNEMKIRDLEDEINFQKIKVEDSVTENLHLQERSRQEHNQHQKVVSDYLAEIEDLCHKVKTFASAHNESEAKVDCLQDNLLQHIQWILNFKKTSDGLHLLINKLKRENDCLENEYKALVELKHQNNRPGFLSSFFRRFFKQDEKLPSHIPYARDNVPLPLGSISSVSSSTTSLPFISGLHNHIKTPLHEMYEDFSRKYERTSLSPNLAGTTTLVMHQPTLPSPSQPFIQVSPPPVRHGLPDIQASPIRRVSSTPLQTIPSIQQTAYLENSNRNQVQETIITQSRPSPASNIPPTPSYIPPSPVRQPPPKKGIKIPALCSKNTKDIPSNI